MFKLIDFGMSKVLNPSSNVVETICGTRPYMSPEMILAKTYSYATDVWGLGCVLYEIVTHRYPFLSFGQNGMNSFILYQDPEPIQFNYSNPLKDIIYSMLNKDQSQRISFEDILSNPIVPKIDNDNHPYENFLVGWKFYHGVGIPQNLPEAMRYFKLSADMNNSFGLNSYGACLINEKFGNLNPSMAMSYFKRSADFGNLRGMYNYGLGLEKGFLGPPNLQEAMRYFKMAADAGDPRAMNNYSIGILHGYLGNVNHTEAMKYSKMSADAGNLSGMFNYASGLEKGFLGPPNIREVMRYYKMAADAGSSRGKAKYESLIQFS